MWLPFKLQARQETNMEMLYFASGLICFNLQNVAAQTPTVAKATSDLI